MKDVLLAVSSIASNAGYTLLLGTFSLFIASTAVFFNHYNWHRARILTATTLFYTVCWLVIIHILVGDSQPFSIAATLLLNIYIIIGYWLGGYFKMLFQTPLTTFKLKMIETLRLSSLISYKTLNILPRLVSAFFDNAVNMIEGTIENGAEREETKKTYQLIETAIKNNIHLL